MCGAYAVVNNPFINRLTQVLAVNDIETRPIRAPASKIQIITENHSTRNLVEAKWWLLLDRNGKPNYKYASFNSRSDKLFSSRLTQGLFKTSRCIIPASGFIEGQHKKYHYIQAKDQAIAFGGIYKSYLINGQIHTTASIITCPGNPQMQNIHKKSIPLILDYTDEKLVNQWLSPDFTESRAFEYLLNNKITQELIATPIKSARDLTAIANSQVQHCEV